MGDWMEGSGNPLAFDPSPGHMMEGPTLVNMQPVGMLHLFKSNRGPAKDFLLYPGLNTIGRRKTCIVILPFPFISNLHAVIEIPAEGRAPYVRDCGSHNGTHLGKPLRRLRPGKSHYLYDKDLIHFAKLHFQFHYLGDPPLLDPEGAVEVEETASLPVIREPQLQGTSLAKVSEEEGDHGVRAFLPQTASDLQPGSPEKATSSRSQATDDPKSELNGQSVQSDMDNQDERDSPDVIFESYKVSRSKPSAPAWIPTPTWWQKKSTSKWVHSSASPATQESSSLGWGREIKRERGKQSGQGQGHLQASNTEPLYPQYSRDKSGSSFRRETQEPFSSTLAPTTSMAAELLPVIPKELSIRAESHQQPPKKQKQGAPRKHVSAPVVPVFPAHPRETSETLKEPPTTFQSQRVVVGKTFQVLQVIPKPSSSLTAEKPALQGTGSQSKMAGGIAGSTGKLQPRVQIQHLTLVTKEPFPCPKEQGRGQPQKCAASKEDKPVEVKIAGSSSQRETKEPFMSSSAPTMSLAANLLPAIAKDLPRRTESHQQIPKKQKQGATREHGSTQPRQYMPTQVGSVLPEHPRERSETLMEPPTTFQSQRVGARKTCESLTVIPKPSSSLTAQKTALQGAWSQSERAGCTAASIWKFQPKVQIQSLSLGTNVPSPCPKEQGRGQPQKRAASEEEEDKPVEVKTAVKTPKGRAVLTIQPNKEVKGMPYQSVGQPNLDEEVKAHMSGKGMPYQSVGQPSLYEEVRAHLSGRNIHRKRRKLRPTAQEEAQGEEAGASD